MASLASRWVIAIALLVAVALGPRLARAEPPRFQPQLGHTRIVEALAITPDDRRIVSIGDSELRVWDLKSGKLLFAHAMLASLQALALVDDHHALLGTEGYQQPGLGIWNVETGALVESFDCKSGRHVAWESETQTLAAACWSFTGSGASERSDNSVRFYRRGTPAPIHVLPEDPLGLAALGGGRFALARGAEIAIVDPASRTLVRQLSAASDTGIAASAGGLRLAAASGEIGAVVLLDPLAGTVLRSFDEPPSLAEAGFWEGLNTAPALGHDGRRLAVASGRTPSTIWLWDAGAATPALPLRGHTSSVRTLAFSREGRLVSGGLDATVRVWDGVAGAPARVLSGAAARAHAFAFTGDGRVVMAAGKSLDVWSLPELRLQISVPWPVAADEVAVTPDGRFALVATHSVLLNASKGTVALWDLEQGRPAALFDRIDPEGPALHTLALSADGRRAVTGGCSSDRTPGAYAFRARALLWDAQAGTVLRVLEARAGRAGTPCVEACVLSADGALVACGEDDGGVRLWRGEADAEVLSAGGKSVLSLALSADDRLLASGGEDGALVVWDVASGRALHRAALGGRVVTVGFTAAGLYAITQADLGERGRRVHRFAVPSWRALGVTDHDVGGWAPAALLPSGEHALFGSDDGPARLLRLDDGAEVWLTSGGGEWMVFSGDGYFDASRNGSELVAAIQGGRGFSVDQIALGGNRPDLLLERVGLGAPERIEHYRAVYRARLRRSGLSADDVAVETALPDARIVAAEQSGAEVSLEVALSAPTRSLASFTVFVNNVPVPGLDAKPVRGRSATVRERVQLHTGRNEVEVSTRDEAGQESLRARSVLHATASEAPSLYVLAVGVSRHRHARLDLAYARADAEALAWALEHATGFGKVETRVLVDEQVTRAALGEATSFVAQARPGDTLVVLVAGHGAYTRDAVARYHFLVHDTDPARLAETGLPFDDIEELLRVSPARKKLFLLDTCESGEREPGDLVEVVTSAEARGLRARAVRRVRTTGPAPAAPAARPFLFERERFIYNDLRRRSGAIVFSSSLGGELSYESDTRGHGLFTHRILEALTGDAADADGDGAITTAELRAYVGPAVAHDTGGAQHPTIDRDNLAVEIALPIVRGLPPRPVPVVPAPRPAPLAPPPGCACHLGVGEPAGVPHAPLAWAALCGLAALRRRPGR